MDLILIYVGISLMIGGLVTGYGLWNSPLTPESSLLAREEYLRQMVEAGHLQREVYGERVVYYEKDMRGEIALKTVESMDRLRHSSLYLVLFFIIATGWIAVAWPNWAREALVMRMRKSQSDEPKESEDRSMKT